MDITRIDEWAAPTGVITGYLPTPAAAAAASAGKTSPIPASIIQHGHIATAADRRNSGDVWSPWIGFELGFKGTLDRAAMAAAVTTYVRRHEGLQTWFDEPTDGLSPTETVLQRRMMDSDRIEFQAVVGPTFANPSQVREYIWGELGEETSPTHWPSAYFTTIEGPDSFTLIHAVDHAFSDGMSLTFAMDEVAQLYRYYRENPGQRDDPLEPVGSHLEYSQQEQQISDSLSWTHPAIRVWLKALALNGGRMPQSCVDLGLGSGERRNAIRQRFELLTPTEMNAFAAAAKNAGGSVSSGLYAATAITDHLVGGRRSMFVLNTISHRPEKRFERAQGWFINLIPMAVRIPRRPVWSKLAAASKRSIDAATPAHEASARSVVDLFSKVGRGMGATVVPPIVSYLDLRHTEVERDPDVTTINALVGPGTTAEVSIWFNRTKEGTFAGASFPDTPEAHRGMQTYFSVMRDVLQTVAQAGDWASE